MAFAKMAIQYLSVWVWLGWELDGSGESFISFWVVVSKTNLKLNGFKESSRLSSFLLMVVVSFLLLIQHSLDGNSELFSSDLTKREIGLEGGLRRRL